MPPLRLCDLPQELITEIFTFIHVPNLLKLCSVCRSWTEIIHGSAQLKYLIELWADGMIAGPSTEPAAALLDGLLARRKGWAHLDWSVRTVIQVDRHSRAYDLVHGVFCQQSGMLFTAFQFPSSAEPNGYHSRTHELEMPNAPRDFVMDPTQDLVAFLQDEGPWGALRLSFRSLSSLKAHPLAAVPDLSFSMDDITFLSMDIAGDVIGVLSRFRSQIVVLDWRRGTIIQNVHSVPHVTSFGFLTPRAYVLGSTIDSGQIEVWKFNQAGTTHVATLQLPETVGGTTIMTFVAHSNAFLASPLHGKKDAKANERRLWVFSLDYEADLFASCFDLFLHHGYLLAYLSMPHEGPTTVAWEEWGPRHSRMVPGISHRWMRYVHGERVVLPRDRNNRSVLTVLDFGLNASRDDAPPEDTSELCAAPSTITQPELFQIEVRTTLPYRRTRQMIGQDHAFFIIDGEHIVGVDDLETELVVYTI